MDYTLEAYSFRFPAGTLYVPFNVSIIDDNEFEDNENFTLAINSSLLPYRATVGYPGVATVTIVDYDGKL